MVSLIFLLFETHFVALANNEQIEFVDLLEKTKSLNEKTLV